MTTEVATWTPPQGGWSSDGNDDIAPAHPMISLTPPISATKEKPAGEFWHSDQEVSTPKLDVVILFRRDTRALFEKGNTEPICRSDDGKRPARDMPLWELEEVVLDKQGKVSVPRFPGQCSICPFSEWVDDAPPACSNSYVLLVDRGNNDLAQLRIKGTSIKPYRDFIAKKPAGKPTYFFRTTITAEEKTKGTNRWYQMAFKAVPLEEEEARRYDALLRSQMHFEPVLDEPDEPSAFMAEVSHFMGEYLMKSAQISEFMGKPFNEGNVAQFMRDNGYAEVEAFISAAQRELPL